MDVPSFSVADVTGTSATVTAFPRRFGPFVLVRPLDGGGMGDVLLALDTRAEGGQLCVVKRMMRDHRSSAEHEARFRREAALASRLTHPNIARTIGIEERGTEPYIVQEFLHGRNLTQLLAVAGSDRQRIAVPVILHIVRQIARGLAFAHELDGEGIVHRDVAPANIMVTFDGDVKLVDFGIARAPSDPSLTEPGMIVGRHLYTAPEIFDGRPADARTDVYSLGVVLWQLLARKPFFTIGPSDAVPAPSGLNAEDALSSDVDAVTLRALAKERRSRFQTARDLEIALAPLAPSDAEGRALLLELLANLYDVAGERERLATDVFTARRLLDLSSLASVVALTVDRPKMADTAETADDDLPAPRKIDSRALAGCGAALLLIGVGWFFISDAWRKPQKISSSPEPTRPVTPGAERVAVAVPAPAPAVAERGPAAVRATLPFAPRAPSRPAHPGAVARGATIDAGGAISAARDSFDRGDFQGAARLARSVLQTGSAPQRVEAHTLLGHVHARSGQYDDAERDFAAAVKLDPGNAIAARRLAAVRQRMQEQR